MGRGRRWAPEELPHLAEAYVATTTNPIVGTDQTSENFRVSLLKTFVAKCPTKYQDREKLSVKNKLTTMALDVQNFSVLCCA
jgi:hypothetical protein